MGAVAPNRFFIWRKHTAGAVQYHPDDLLRTEQEVTDVRYFIGLAVELDRALPNRGLTFLTTWELDALDEQFADAVVILIGDEMYRTPAYAPTVRVIFKTGGTQRNPLAASARLHPALAWRVLLRELRNSALALRRHGVSSTPVARMYALPIGYYGLTDVSFVPFDERRVDVFFAGSVQSASGFTVRPRSVARRQMSTALAATQTRLPELKVQCGLFAQPGERLGPSAYSEQLMDAKIALCPRGNFDETFRVVEAARFGCVAICEPLPRRWYNRDSPVVQIDRWHSLPDVVASLVADPPGMAERSLQMVAWWNACLSERAVASFMAQELGRVAEASASVVEN